MFDPFALAGAPDPYPIYRELRESGPVHHSSSLGFWALPRFDEVRAASRDWPTFSNAGGVDLDELGRKVFGPGDFLDMDPPEHDELRAVVKSRFTPKSVALLEPLITDALEGLLERVPAGDPFDAVAELAWPLPTRVMCTLLGCPSADHAELTQLYGRVMERCAGATEIPADAVEAAADMRAYLLDLARQRRAVPRDDLMTEVALARTSEGPLPEPKIVGMCFVLFSAGIDTVASLIGNSLLLLGEHTHQRQLLLDEPRRIPAAIEEILRFESPLQFNARTTTRTADVDGTTIPAGERVLLLYGCANRDERRFDEPDRFDVSREPKRHLGFGEGIHFCIGAPLARLQTRITLETWLSRWPDYSIDGPAERSPTYNMRGLAALPLRTHTPSS